MKKNIPKFLAQAFPYAVSLTFFFLFLETYIYPGFVRKAIFIDIRLVIIFTFTSGLVGLIFNHDKEPLASIILSINQLLLPVFIVFYLILSISNHQKFDNYIFSTYHLHYQHFKYIVFFSIILVTLDMLIPYKIILRKVLLESIKKSARLSLLFTFVIAILFSSLINNVFTFTKHVLDYHFFLFSHPFATFEEKSRYILGDYDFFTFLKNYSNDLAVIAIPPQMNPWLTVGNGGYLRYFTYPKRVLNTSLNQPLPDEINYAVIAKGGWTPPDKSLYGWPKIKLEAEKIWYFIPDDGSVIESTETTYNPIAIDRPIEYQGYEWGLIKLKK